MNNFDELQTEIAPLDVLKYTDPYRYDDFMAEAMMDEEA